MPISTSFILPTTLTLSLSLSCYLIYHHRRLHHSTSTTHRDGTLAAHSIPLDNLETVPTAVFSSGQFFSVYDRAARIVPRNKFPALNHHHKLINHGNKSEGRSEGDLLTLYLRHTLTLFTSLPQAYLIKFLLLPRSARYSFGADYINSLSFVEGDVVCGVYTVLLRTARKVEFGIAAPGGADGVQGRLVVGINPDIDLKGEDQDEEGRVEVYSETAMWRDADSRVVMPLERALGRAMHELAAWWLLERGVEYLQRLD
ncbi:hypothetical protein BGW36DRAFT_353256 [Talaromyces proteolyticus]|uniref:Uncharacterized protein n=1 Tax=Talaromyces proteolyticus TaxID=1131652 RepID=A0AAD4KZK9_9EURO|nr:uncharacterized protein BGW36DRAFT_353256 [Talaromyces proteolyticus]KAH8704808.1 hypothetical protein BGW36DRAFT_353256 [Talaromyces proteolyticus]